MSKPISDRSADRAQIENAVRTAALVAARGVPLSESDLSSIVAATSDPSLSVADRIQRATSMAKQYVTAPKPLNIFSATPQEIAAQTQVALQFGGASRVGAAARAIGAASGNSGYSGLSATDPRALQSITMDKFNGSALESAGLDFSTLSYLRSQGRTLTAQNILNAANDAKALGFGPKDRAAMLDHAIIDRHDPKARITNKALQNYQKKLEGDETLADLYAKGKEARTPEERTEIQTQAEGRRAELAKESGLSERLEDKVTPQKARAATERRKTAVERKAEEKYEQRARHDGAAKPTDATVTKSSADMFKKLTAASPK